MSKRQVSSVVTQVEYKPGKYRQVSNVMLQVEYQPAALNITYNRQSAALYAIGRSKVNFEGSNFPFGNGEPLTQGAPRGVGGNSAYSFLTHITGNTGSATFISEMFHFGGGLPMRICEIGEPNCSQPQDAPLWSWLFRCGAGFNLEATSSWRDHRFLRDYFQQVHGASAMTGVPYSDLLTSMYFDENGYEGGGTWRDGYETNGQQYLYDLFSGQGLGDIDTGDYVFLDLGLQTSAHGFLIVGWGSAVNCPEGLNTQSGRNNFSTTRQANTIPYVVDFCYGYASDVDKSGWLQDPRPDHSIAAARPLLVCS